MNRIAALILFALPAITSPARADEAPDPCAFEATTALHAAAAGTPEETAEARQALNECYKRATEQRKRELVESRNTWAAGLDKLPAGAWVLLTVASDGTYALFGSHRHGTRKGSVVAVWLRYEYREAKSDSGATYLSEVERTLYDCERVASKLVAITYYNGNNLDGAGRSSTYDEEKESWDPVIPGTMGDALLDWACRTTPGGQPAKTK
jgi:hypothetical protein